MRVPYVLLKRSVFVYFMLVYMNDYALKIKASCKSAFGINILWKDSKGLLGLPRAIEWSN